MARTKRRRRLIYFAVGLVLFVIVGVLTDDKAGASLGKAVLIETDFGASAEPVRDVVTGKLSKAIAGVVARGWWDPTVLGGASLRFSRDAKPLT